MKELETTTKYYPLPIVTQDAVDEVTLRVGKYRRDYSTRVLLEMRLDDGNVELQEALLNFSDKYKLGLDKKRARFVAAVAYDMLNQQAKIDGTKLPYITNKSVRKFVQVIRNENITPKKSFSRIYEENHEFAYRIGDCTIEKTIKDINTKKACVGIVSYLHELLKTQAREDVLSEQTWGYESILGFEWIVAEE